VATWSRCSLSDRRHSHQKARSSGDVWFGSHLVGCRSVRLSCPLVRSANPRGCVVMSKLAEGQGVEFVIGDEYELDGKKIDSRRCGRCQWDAQ
jgi:hypothetical protein